MNEDRGLAALAKAPHTEAKAEGWHELEINSDQVAAAILAALDGWTLIRDTDLEGLQSLRQHKRETGEMKGRLRRVDAEIERLRAVLGDGIEAFRLTREYVGEEKTLPAVLGWSWFDWCEKVRAALAHAKEVTG